MAWLYWVKLHGCEFCRDWQGSNLEKHNIRVYKRHLMQTVDVYNSRADIFEKQYISVNAEDVHQAWLTNFLPNNGNVLDVGAGVGRDAKYMAEKGLKVIAVEPASELLIRGKKRTEGLDVVWLEDALPNLQATQALGLSFDLILLSAVWMHIAKSEREMALKKLASLFSISGVMVITLRHGDSPDAREMYPVSIKELRILADRHDLVVHPLSEQEDKLQRSDVYWETVVITRSST
jgi:2-polyprenyl-3-methyl-5-hydroxy-6-metoxy-1,4-benzoquinol methylase